MDLISTAALVAARVAGALWSPITDCDETFNYWEPAYLLAARTHALQTWEYAPVHALRSYAYLAPHAAVMTLFASIFGAHVAPWRSAFFATRLVLALASAAIEVRLAAAVGGGIGGQRLSTTLKMVLAASPGMFHSAPAFLPSSFAMAAVGVHLAAWFQSSSAPKPSRLAIAAIACSALLGWPFAAALGIPFFLSYLMTHPRPLVVNSVLAGVVVAVPMVLIDSFFYGSGSIHLVPWQMIQYNVVRNQSHLYGVEPASFYLKNLVLNWSGFILLAAGMSVWDLGSLFILKLNHRRLSPPQTWGPATMLALWLTVFVLQPHKEERFLAPIYPAIAVQAARGVVAVPRVLRRLATGRSALLLRLGVAGSMSAFALMGVLRMLAMVRFYGAPVRLDVSSSMLPHSADGVNATVCVGNDWFLSAGHALLPAHARIKFVRQAFDGQLPAEYAVPPPPSSGPSALNAWAELLRVRDATARVGHASFSDANELDLTRFVPESQCDYILGRDPIVTGAKPVACEPILLAESTPTWARIVDVPAGLPFSRQVRKAQVWDKYCLWVPPPPGQGIIN
ncbi:Alg9-like mannosyltransferase family-domain-containing protein [Blastocladiella britannica]|nr:Alg9-like mannosyltransferase family-domain-containing protein [Blastocladiella britannica]